MASIKVKFRPSAVSDREGVIYFQITHRRKTRQIPSDYHIFPGEWDEKRQLVTKATKKERVSYILALRERIRRDVERLTKIIRTFESEGLDYTVDDVIDESHRREREQSLFGYLQNIIFKLKKNGKVRTSETYTAALNSFKKFRNGKDLMLDSLTSEIMEAYVAWHKAKGNIPNTISFYTRILRAAYRRAVEDGIIEDRNPFRRVYTGVDKTVKRALPLSVIKKIRSMDLSCSPKLDFARDMFMLSFMLRGMSFIDMAFLKKTDLSNGHITYRRRKTGQLLTIKWTAEMQMILDKYHENSSDYLLPIIRNKGINERSAYRNVGYNINHNLKRIAYRLGITIPLTLYVARHSWASAAKAKGIPVSVISEGMGHDSETTTLIYLASLDTTAVDKANSVILSSI